MRKRLGFLGAALLMIAGPAAADTFVLGPPSTISLDFEGNGFFFTGEGFSARQNFEAELGLFFGASPGCDPCTVGQTYDPSFTTTNTFMGKGTATVGSTSYSNVSFFGDLSVAATPIAFPDTDADGVRIKAPFTFTGTLRGFQSDTLAFSVDLTGVGFSDRFFDRFSPGDNRFGAGENRLSYFFTESPAQTPEPASMLLLGTGIVGLIARRFKSAAPSR